MKSVKKLQIGFILTLLIILGIAQTSPANEPNNFLDKLTPFSATKLLKTFTNISDHRVYDGSKTYAVSHFTGLGIAVTMDVIVNLGNQVGVRIEGDEAAIEDLIVEVKGNNLVIRTRETWKLWQKKHAHTKLKAVISAKQLSSISMASSGNIKVNNTIQTKQLAINISGSGKVEANAQVVALNCAISGSGTLHISGTAEKANVAISGSGRIKEGLKVQQLSAVISGSGHVNANVSSKLDAVISGSGSINYSGNPQIQRKISGSGRINKV